jgi:antirestriction protein ArdC
MRNIHKNVTDRIVAQLKVGTVPWRQPWSGKASSGGDFSPRNAVTGRAYSGVNIILPGPNSNG